jgi:hypothetical protein
MKFQSKKPAFFLACILCFTQSIRAQNFQLSLAEINFQTKTEVKTDSLPLTINNLKNQNLSLKLSVPFRVYKSQPFWINDSLISLAPNGAKTIQVYCRISHNISQSAHLLVFTKDTSVPLQSEVLKIRVQGRYSKTYYSTTENLNEEPLKAALKARTGQGYNGFSYDAARGIMYGSLDNKNDTVTCVYTLRKAKFNTTGGASSNNFNCEHTFPQGFFSQNLPMRSDMHHLFSTDEAANNSRGNLPFGIATPPLVQPTINAPSKNGGGKYEPQDGHKGNCARAMMYFVLRYQDYSNFFNPQEQILRTWHQTFLPKPADTLRNAIIFAQQNNRNPFVDYPQFADRINKLVSLSASDSSKKWRQSADDIRLKPSFPSQSLSVSVWNEGNQGISVTGIRMAQFRYNFLNVSNQSFVLGFNEAKTIRFTSNALNGEYLPDTLIMETTDANYPQVRIPLIIDNATSVNPLYSTKPSLFPNPAEDKIFLHWPENHSKLQISLSDIKGKNLKNLETSKPETEISLQELNSGMYFIQVKNGKDTFWYKIIKP